MLVTRYPQRNPNRDFCKIDKLTLKFIRKCREQKPAKAKLNKKNKKSPTTRNQDLL